MQKTYTFKAKGGKDCVFRNFELKGVAEGMVAHANVRIVVRGRASLNRVDTEKFGPQIHIQVYGDQKRIEARNPSVHNRAEIYLSLEQARELFEALYITLLEEKYKHKVVNNG